MLGKQEYSLSNASFYLFLACFQCITLGGLIFGLPLIANTLIVASIEIGGVALTLDDVQAISNASYPCYLFAWVIFGAIIDNYGQRFCSLLATAVITIGIFLLVVSSSQNTPMIIFSMCCMFAGGPGIQLSALQVINVIPYGWKYLATAIIAGSFQLSFITFFIFNQIWTYSQTSYQSLFLSYLIICAINLAITLRFWSKEIPVNPDEPETLTNLYLSSSLPISSEYFPMIQMGPLASHRRVAVQPLRMISSTLSQLKSIFMSRQYQALCLFFACNAMLSDYMMESVEYLIKDVTRYDADRSDALTTAFGFSMWICIISIPAIGILIEHFEYVIISCVIIMSGFLWSLCILLHSEAALIWSFIFFNIYRTILFFFIFVFAKDVLSNKHFGILLGGASMVAGVVNLLLYPLASYARGTCFEINEMNTLCSHGNRTTTNALVMVMLLVSTVFCYEIRDVKKGNLTAETNDIGSINRKGYGSVTVQE